MTGKVRKRLFRQRRFRQLFIGLALISFLLGVIIVPIEQPYNSKINNLGDSFYWVVTTLTTVGYGDVVPVSGLGRFLAVILQLLGTVMFGTIVAMISLAIARYEDEFLWQRLFERLDRLEDKIEKVKKRSDYLVHEQEHTNQTEDPS